jgi:uncharacterized protein YjdB
MVMGQLQQVDCRAATNWSVGGGTGTIYHEYDLGAIVRNKGKVYKCILKSDWNCDLYGEPGGSRSSDYWQEVTCLPEWTVKSITISFNNPPEAIDPSQPVTIVKGKDKFFTATVLVVDRDDNENGEEKNKKFILDLIPLDDAELGTDISKQGKVSIDANETLDSLLLIAKSDAADVSPDDQKSDTVIIYIVDADVQSVEIDDKEIMLDRFNVFGDNEYRFTATVDVDPSDKDEVKWEIITDVDEETSIDEDGNFTLSENETADTIKVVATSAANRFKKDTAIVINSKIKDLEIVIKDVADKNFTVEADDQNDEDIEFEVSALTTGLYTGAVEWSILDEDGEVYVGGGTSFSAEQDLAATLSVSKDETQYRLKILITSKEDSLFFDTAFVKIERNKPQVEITSVEINPKDAILAKGATIDFTVTIDGINIYEDDDDDDVEWTIISDVESETVLENKTKTGATLVIAADETAEEILIEVKSQRDEDKADTAVIKIKAVKNIIVTPDSESVERGKTLQFNANVEAINGAAQTVTWSKLNGIAATSVNSNGLLTVAVGETAASIKIVATSTFDASVKCTTEAAVTIPPVTSVSVSPKTRDVTKGGSPVTFTKSVLPAAAKQEVVWSVLDAVTSTINNGTLTVPASETASIIKVVASATDDSEKADTAVITLNNPVAISNMAKGRNEFGILLYQTVAVENAEFEVLTPQPSDVSITVSDNTGNVLYSDKGMTKKIGNANSLKVEWDLTNRNGRKVASGKYIIQAIAKNASGQVYKYYVPLGVKK